ncbi:hypothetical protein AVEN_93179-1 [Araneus ventricosus]|uniref:Uncharacterized protein n=1 Tax=Araneus ventricosus TaxID=182803 RepID=A0A4Y2NUI5_ARAVE|nr:hypothetical protein AVEN_93179-1 [Araneus ventricosus]
MELHKWSANNQSLLCNEMKESDYSFTNETETLELACGAVIYVKSINSYGDSEVKLFISKSRVAPLKCVSVLHLELCAAFLLAKLMRRVLSALKLEVSKTSFWTDSTIVLSWLKSKDLKTFVANRISIIRNLTVAERWHHVPAKQNPTDLISRGMDQVKLQQCELWWSPSFLLQPEMIECHSSSIETNYLFLCELKPPIVSEVCILTNTIEPLGVINNCSSYPKMKRVVAWCKRFLNNIRHPLHPNHGTSTSSELSHALLCIVKNVQRTSFVTENQCLEKGVPIPNSSKLLNLCQFLDKDGILHVGSRLKNSDLSEIRKHPMVLPTKHNFTVNVINHFHVLYFHAGAETTSLIRNKFWIVSARNLIRKIIFNCIIYKRVNYKSAQQQMADLPASIVTIFTVFSRTGLDFCSPFVIKIM